ncbi:MAG: hypothetical protein AAGC47_13480 [Bacteroidota bacterium]
MKRLLLFVITLSTSLSSYSQNKFSTILEFGGPGLISVNGEYSLLQKENYQVNVRAGIGYIPEEGTDFLSVPLGGNFVYNLKNRHHLESGLALSYLRGAPGGTYIYASERFNFKGEGIYFSPSFGYRYDKMEKGFVFRLAYSPMFVLHDYYDVNMSIDKIEEVLGYESFIDPIFLRELPVAENVLWLASISVGYRF